jgi:multiple antibiotic resistance protein
MMTEAALSSFVAALFSVMNPIGNVGIFAGLTEGRDEAQTKRTAWTCAVAVAIILLVVTWTGSLLLDFFGITVDALRAAGGVIVFLIGLNMLNNNKSHQQTAIVLTLSALIGFLFSFAEPISKRLGESGMGVVTRVMGMILATIAIGMLADGLKGLMPGLAG